MRNFIVLYNSKANNNHGEEQAKKLSDIMSDNLVYFNMTEISDYELFLKQIKADDNIILCGGDGTLNYFVNHVDTDKLKNEVFYYPTGRGNDFLRDIGLSDKKEPVCITKYLKNLPIVKVKNKKIKFLNNASFGLDGYCCEEADRQIANKGKASSYTLIAVKGLLGAYKPRNATIIVDGVKREYKKVWLAPTMNGRYLGGGLMASPYQNRLNEKHTVTVAVMYGSNRLKSLLVMPAMFKGNHIKRTEMIQILEGREISIKYDRPTPMQIDGETIPNVIKCTIKAH